MKNYLQEFLNPKNNLTYLTTKILFEEHQQIEQLHEKKLSSNLVDDYLTTSTTKIFDSDLTVNLSSNCQVSNLTINTPVNLVESIGYQTEISSCQIVKPFYNNEKIPIETKLINGKEITVYKSLDECKEKGGCFRFRLNCSLFPTVAKDGKLAFLCHDRF